VSVIEYLLVIGAITNVINTAITLGQRIILSWGCTTMFAPLLWTILAAVIHIIASASYAITHWKETLDRDTSILEKIKRAIFKELTIGATAVATEKPKSGRFAVV
jgi:hypothetical protein